MDSAAIADLLHSAGGFARTLGPRVVRSSRQEAVVRLPDRPELHNHVGGPHAAALFGLGELASFVLLLEVFGDLVESGSAVPLIKSATVEYTAVATGPVLATARLAGPADDAEAGARASLEQRGVAVFGVEVVVTRESDGRQTALMRPQMALKRLGG